MHGEEHNNDCDGDAFYMLLIRTGIENQISHLKAQKNEAGRRFGIRGILPGGSGRYDKSRCKIFSDNDTMMDRPNPNPKSRL